MRLIRNAVNRSIAGNVSAYRAALSLVSLDLTNGFACDENICSTFGVRCRAYHLRRILGTFYTSDRHRQGEIYRIFFLTVGNESIAQEETDRMSNRISRRDLLKTSLTTGATYFAAGDIGDLARYSSLYRVSAGAEAEGAIVPLTSSSDVYVPPRGQSFFKFSFDFPEPSAHFAGLLFSARLHTFENTYGLDRDSMTVESNADGALTIRASRLIWAGGQQEAPGNVAIELHKNGNYVECRASAEMQQPIKSLAIIVRGVPRGQVSSSCNEFFDPKDDEISLAHPYLFGGMTTPLVVIKKAEQDFFFLSALNDRVQDTRFYLQPGEKGYRVELVYEQAGWNKRNRIETPTWRLGEAHTYEEAAGTHFQHVERAFHIPEWEKREDVPAWFRQIEIVIAIHGMHWTGYVFNDFAKTQRTLEWVATQISADRVLVFLPAWDGRYYWNYPIFKPEPLLGGDNGFRALIQNSQRLGFRMMPMFGANAANRNLTVFSQFADATTQHIDGDAFDLDWVDMDNDRSNDGWGSFMNLGVDCWREYLFGRISETIDRFGVDAYFLDIAGAWVNNLRGDMYEGTVRLVKALRTKHPNVLAVGEMHYDALMACIPVYQVPRPPLYPQAMTKYARSFQHLSRPAPGRGSTGVHEDGFQRFEPTMPHQKLTIPTITVVDDTFEKYRDVMAQLIATTKQRAGIG